MKGLFVLFVKLREFTIDKLNLIVYDLKMLIIIITFLVFFYIGTQLSKTTVNSKVYCNQHKWAYREQEGHEYMICEVCNRRPGENFGEQL